MKTFTVGKNDAGKRLDQFILRVTGNLPSSLLYKSFRKKRFKVNGKRITDGAYRLSEGDFLELYISDEFFENVVEEEAFLKVSGAVNVLYEDEHILLADKPIGLLSHSDDKEWIHTLIAHVQSYLYKKGEWNPKDENGFAPALCNRIDRNTGGIVIAAKTAEALRILNDKIKNHELKKKYLCVVLGKLEKPSGEIINYLLKDEKKNMVTVYQKPHAGAKEAVTRYRVLEYKDGLSLLEVELLTGRTHQIRATFADLGHPLLGDGKYGINQVNLKHGMTTQALYSYQLTFAFKTDAGVLNHLNGKTVTVENVPFVEKYF
ncbi:MAG: RluA family pseudouridine synthase [Clostridia bacterium]|nr:RluA family pseudouridine synthase [Clostridia bacterium]